MAASLKAAKKVKIDYNIAKEIYDEFIRQCTRKGYAPNAVVEKMMVKYTETGQI